MGITDPGRAGLLALMVLAAGAVSPAAPQSSQDQAFPGAIGYGAGATGWRGGALIAVTNLDDAGPGSLRACVEAEGPRLCIFRVSGTIRLDAPLMAQSNLYIAGQTAPGKGIQLRMNNATHGPLIVKDAHDVVVRFLKLRPGGGEVETPNIDALTVENASNLYFGNLSLMFATDETFNIHVAGGRAVDITLTDSILAYSLDRANHPKGRHSKGALICSGDGTGNECGRVSLLRNYFAHHRDRNPDIKATAGLPVEVINNIFYNPISQFGEFYDLLGDTRIAYVGNVALTGPSTVEKVDASVQAYDWTEGNDLSIWAQDNLARDCAGKEVLAILDPEAAQLEASAPMSLTMTPLAATELMPLLRPRVGDVLPGGGHRDRLDRKVLAELDDCKGQVIDRARDAGGWPKLDPVEPPVDTDGDLLPDEWEAGRPGLDPTRPDDPWQPDSQGMAAVETWLAQLAGDA
ncbi:pectate lyase family protein [Paracoccus xiamenensis]|uniref:pectate lyase family protein n=1 Tax=Paracoccus xiamenensis TaxID=2714901 RepID=UPI0014083D3B|nr:hypothetical protein [Paracoccus xiamenensis]NHF73091.1 hypothetical protein [Paracoccus xiamenensis]